MTATPPPPPPARPLAPLAAVQQRRSSPAPPPADPLGQAEVCAVCPKLCATTCPVQAATGRESVAPWRISATVRDARRDGWTPAALHAASSCTGCGGCTSACLVGVVLPVESRAARADAAAAGVLLPAAERVRARVAATGSPRRAPLPADLAAGDAAAPTVVLDGCAVAARAPEVGRAARRLLAAAGEPARGMDACCGAVATDLGLAAEAAALARGAAEALAGAERVVALTPSCARMLREGWPALGLAAPPVLTAPEWLASARPRLPLRTGTGRLVWHQPCTLGPGGAAVLAGLGYDVVDAGPGCSGEGAAYRLVDAAGAAAVAARRGPVDVTACPSAARALGARDLVEVAAELLP